MQCEGIPGGPGGGQKPKLFGYNVVFEPGASQADVVEYSGIKRIIEMAIEGFSCTAFCYGQTGSGKTHTLTGPPELVRQKNQHNSLLNFIAMMGLKCNSSSLGNQNQLMADMD